MHHIADAARFPATNKPDGLDRRAFGFRGRVKPLPALPTLRFSQQAHKQAFAHHGWERYRWFELKLCSKHRLYLD
jgi:hypothetical protein